MKNRSMNILDKRAYDDLKMIVEKPGKSKREQRMRDKHRKEFEKTSRNSDWG